LFIIRTRAEQISVTYIIFRQCRRERIKENGGRLDNIIIWLGGKPINKDRSAVVPVPLPLASTISIIKIKQEIKPCTPQNADCDVHNIEIKYLHNHVEECGRVLTFRERLQ